MCLSSECIWRQNVPRMIHHQWPEEFVTNRCIANPNTSPDSPSNGDSEEFGFALHLFVTKIEASRVMDYPWCDSSSHAFRRKVHLASYAFSRWMSFGVICSKGLILITTSIQTILTSVSCELINLAHGWKRYSSETVHSIFLWGFQPSVLLSAAPLN